MHKLSSSAIRLETIHERIKKLIYRHCSHLCSGHQVIYDYNGLLNKKNQFPTYPYPLHTFLLDRNNKVLAIGNPINNESIRNIFDKIIKRE